MVVMGDLCILDGGGGGGEGNAAVKDAITSESDEYSGELWVGTKVNKTWRESITLSALVKKFNAFGPSVSETSANYWEADVWLKWEF